MRGGWIVLFCVTAVDCYSMRPYVLDSKKAIVSTVLTDCKLPPKKSGESSLDYIIRAITDFKGMKSRDVLSSTSSAKAAETNIEHTAQMMYLRKLRSCYDELKSGTEYNPLDSKTVKMELLLRELKVID